MAEIETRGDRKKREGATGTPGERVPGTDRVPEGAAGAGGCQAPWDVHFRACTLGCAGGVRCAGGVPGTFREVPG